MNLDNIVFSTKDSAAINFVKARMAIEETMPNREQKRAAKMVVVQHLHGELQPAKHGRIVVFPDHTKARF